MFDETGREGLIAVAVAIALDDGAIRRTGERRLSIAIGVSLLVHAVTIASLVGVQLSSPDGQVLTGALKK